MDWFRWWHGTVTDPKFQWVARKSGQPVGSVIAVWAALLECASNATQCNDATRGNVASFHPEDFDILFGSEDGSVASIIAAMTQKGLIEDGAIARWNERQPKREDSGNPNTGALSSTERSRLRREKLKRNEPQCNGMQRNATQCNDRVEKIRGEESKDLSNSYELLVDSDAADLPEKPQADACPHKEIIAAYHEILPACPSIRDWTPARQKTLRARWAEDKSRQSVGYWRKLFAYIAESRFLTGRSQTSNGKPPFTASLDWIVKAENFAKIREGRYHKDAE
jgi:hypothetical protein